MEFGGAIPVLVFAWKGIDPGSYSRLKSVRGCDRRDYFVADFDGCLGCGIACGNFSSDDPDSGNDAIISAQIGSHWPHFLFGGTVVLKSTDWVYDPGLKQLVAFGQSSVKLAVIFDDDRIRHVTMEAGRETYQK
jgi:hypothetical protein